MFPTLSNVTDGSEAWLIGRAAREADGVPLVAVARDDVQMAQIAGCLPFFAPDVRVLCYPAWDCLPYDRVSPHADLMQARIETLVTLASGSGIGVSQSGDAGPLVILTTVNALIQRTVPAAVLRDAGIVLHPGASVDREGLVGTLAAQGYARVSKVMEPGEFAVRGSILDVYGVGGDPALRLDFFDDVLESIRPFDPETQLTHGAADSFRLLPASEVLLNEDTIRCFRRGYRERFSVAASTGDPLAEAVAAGRKYAGMEHWLPLFYEKPETLLEYVQGFAGSALQPRLLLCPLAEDAVKERFAAIVDHYAARAQAPKLKGMDTSSSYRALPPEALYLTETEWERICEEHPATRLSAFADPESRPAPLTPARDFAPERKQDHANLFTALQTHLERLRAEGKRLLLTCHTEGSADRLALMLKDHGVVTQRLTHLQDAVQALADGVTGLAVLPLPHGFTTDDGLAILSEQDIFGARIVRRAPKKRNTEQFFAEVAAMQPGELVVHTEHGIGRFEGLEAITAAGAAHDCLRLVYDGGDKLYLPVENIDAISRYGEDGGDARLDKLGGVAWQARKARLKERLKLAAEALLKVAAERALSPATPLAPHPGLYEEFCARFPYAETDDQLRAIEETLEGLSDTTPMDRLICGDVGFGKTEVALRAAFAAVCPDPPGEKLQVAVVSPTTVLCRQHYRTFIQRFHGFPVRIRQLSRLGSAKENRETRDAIAAGEVDIIVGTHALLAKSVRFRNLGLLIVDEEQHFGVAQKERLKQMKHSIHVLTLSATPIPRTLQLSLAGVRELSLMTTPPVDRLAIRTFVMPFDPVVVREALLREHYRGGQSFAVVPRIKDMAELEATLRQLVPELTIESAHGQMAAGALDRIMNAFYDRRFDVLVSTAIVESGLDVPSANTMLIHRADRFGLSQLYQLRGRVGRSKQRAYAYLTLKHGQMPTKQALRRLEIMQQMDSLGMGFTLASHDLDLRGAGNLLGDEQSGHIREVGVELYQHMLEEAIAAVREGRAGKAGAGEGSDAAPNPQINLGLPVSIPESYVPDLSLRLALYRRAGELSGEDERESFAAELIDRFGSPLPEETQNLLDVMGIKHLCRQAHIVRLDSGPRGLVMTFHQDTFPNPEALITWISRHPATAKLRGDQKLVITRNLEDASTRLGAVRELLEEIAGLSAPVGKAA